MMDDRLRRWAECGELIADRLERALIDENRCLGHRAFEEAWESLITLRVAIKTLTMSPEERVDQLRRFMRCGRQHVLDIRQAVARGQE